MPTCAGLSKTYPIVLFHIQMLLPEMTKKLLTGTSNCKINKNGRTKASTSSFKRQLDSKLS